jgi:PAS domain S-box-containing protein
VAEEFTESGVSAERGQEFAEPGQGSMEGRGVAEPEPMERMKAEDRFRELLEAAPDAIIEVDEAGRIILMNAATEKLFGYSRGELLGQTVEALIPAQARMRHAEHRTQYRNHPATRPMGTGMTLLARRKDGSEFPVEISLSPVQSEEGLRVTAIVRDVTERKKFEEEIRAANQQLEARAREVERADRLKTEFLASMSHELRTPLHTIIGFTDLLAEELEGPLNEKQKRFLSHVHQDSQHLLELINDILDLSKIEAGQMELHPSIFDARAVIADAINSVRPLANAKNIFLENRVEGDAFVRADPVRLREILNNLLGNAIKFTPEQGNVWIDAEAAAGRMKFTVGDTGIGISPEDQEAIFDKFRQVGPTTRGLREGTGLGLAIVKRLVEMHGGTITVESEPGVGSRFHFTVPADGESSRLPPLVLIIEDEPSARELLANYLAPLGVRTQGAASAEEGVRLARELKPDLITLDVLLPGQSGWRALRELRADQRTAEIPVFVISVLDHNRTADQTGATEYLQKPLSKDALLRALRRYVPERFGMV